ncbi:MAG: peptidase M3, partial [Acidimicrobiia bacterium]|nr:peptidase M3 [Acidimicrobiia bacterium]
MEDLAPLLGALTDRLQPLDDAANVAWWRASTDVSPDHEAARIDADIAIRTVLGDADLFDRLRATTVGGSGERRQRDVLIDRMRPHQIPPTLRDEIARLEARLDGAYNSFRPVLAGAAVDDNHLAEILRHSDSGDARQAAWEASKQVGTSVAAEVRELAHLRNRAARELGSRDYFALALETSELDETDLFATLEAIDAATREPFAAWKAEDDRVRAERFGCPPAELRPWHYDDPFFQSAPGGDELDLDTWFESVDLIDITRRTYTGIGIDIDPILARSDLEPRGGKSQHAFCIDIDRAGDIRVLCNNVPGVYWSETMLHEFGHAIYDAGVDHALPWPVRTMHPLTTEGIAMLFGRLTLDPEWLVEVLGLDPETVAASVAALSDRRRTALLVFARWVLVMTNFERGFYADPDADHNRRWWDLVERFQLLTRPDGRDAPDWAAKLHVALAPVYYQNYLLGELVASQIQAT